MGPKPASATSGKRSGSVLASASSMEDHLALRAAVDSLSTATHTHSPKRTDTPSRAADKKACNTNSGTSTRHSKRLGSQGIGGNGRQSSLDSWMSSQSALGKENRRVQSAPSPPGSPPCRSAPRRPKSDYEPFSLLSVQAAPQTPQRNSTPRRASPRKRTSNVNEVSCSEDEEPETVTSQVSQTSLRAPQTHIISSDDNEADDGRLEISPRIRRRRRSVREVIKSSDDEDCEDPIRSNPVAEDLVPQSDKAPWSTVSGPEQDIVLATPKRDRVRHYTVLDSDHELSEEEKDLPMFTPNRANVASRHLSLPVLDSEGEESGHALTKPRPLVLEQLSDDDSSEEPTSASTSVAVPVELKTCRPIPQLQAISKDALASPSAAQLRKRHYIAAQRRAGKDPFAEFEKYRLLKRKAEAPAPDNPEVVDITEGDDEPWQVPCTKNPSERPSTPSPPKLRKLTDVAPNPSDLAAALRMASFCGRRAALNGTANPTHLPVFKKASSLEPINPGARPPPRLRRVSEHAPEVAPTVLQRTETLESISSFSTASGSQQDLPRMDLTGDSGMLPVDEIEYFSDDPRTQRTANTGKTNESVQAKRQSKHYSPLRLASNSRPATPSKALEHGQLVQQRQQGPTENNQECAEKEVAQPENEEPLLETEHCGPLPLHDTSRSETPSEAIEHGQGVTWKDEARTTSDQLCTAKDLSRHEPKEPAPEPNLDLNSSQSQGDLSPTLPPSSVQKCPLCGKMISEDDLIAHVDEELRIKDQETKDARQKQDEALAVALTETYQTQDAMFNSSLQRGPQTQDLSQGQHATPTQTPMRKEYKTGTNNQFVTPSRPKSVRDIVSMETPMRKIGEMALNSPLPGSKPSRDTVSMYTPMRKIEEMTLSSPVPRSKPVTNAVSVDTPMRKIGELALNSPFSGTKTSRGTVSTETAMRKTGRMTRKSPLSAMTSCGKKVQRDMSSLDPSARVKDGESSAVSEKLDSQALTHEPAHDYEAPDHEQALFSEADSLSSQTPPQIQPGQIIESSPSNEEWSHYLDPDSLSSQNPLRIQPGQIIESTPPEQYISTPPSAHSNSPLFLDPFSLSSQNPFMMQPGQAIESTPEAYFSTRPNARTKLTGKERSRERINNQPNMEKASPQALTVSDDSLDDLDDFLNLPEPASMLNRSFRTKAKANKDSSGATPKKNNKSPKKAPSRAGKATGRKGTITLDDSDDEDCVGGEADVIKQAKGASKAKLCILDRMLPLSARQRRQSILKKRAARESNHKTGTEADKAGTEADIEIGRHLTEKLWNANDDLFDSEGLDRRQVKGVGLGGVVGGIGAVSGSLAVSNITKNAMEATRAKEGAEMLARQDTSPDEEHRDDVFTFSQPSYELEDPNYGLSSQDWWTGAKPNNDGGHSDHIESKADDGWDAGYLSPLEDFVDLRKRRDDPTVAMYFAQFDCMGADGNEGGGSKTTRGKKRGGARGRGSRGTGKGVSYAAGVGPMPTTSGSSSTTGEGSAQRGSPFAGTSAIQSTLPFGGHATTANGSMAIRSKPTPAFTPGGSSRGRGGGSKSTWKRNPWAWRGRGRGGWGGRGRGAPY
ncbi:hypothetical protein EC968_001003 [Mortierella alpina]|nr:hypothetical protein EC968_001003 [Mortierella alpina]